MDNFKSNKRYTLPSNSPMMRKSFIYGVATSSFQIEGAHESRLPCIWDSFCQRVGAISDSSNGEVACEHVKLWQQDVEMIESLGVDAYRLSIAWGRVVNENGEPNLNGLAFYKTLCQRLQALGIKVFVTLYHWDLPQHLEDKGGWLNRQTAYEFARYADIVSHHLGELVDSYATLNEPFCSAYLGYEIGIHAPGKQGQFNGRQAAHHLLLAHGLAMRVLRKNVPKVESGIVLNFANAHSETDAKADTDAAKLADQYHNHWYIAPLLTGEYPPVMQRLNAQSRPVVEAQDMAIISEPVDFIGVNYYTRNIYRSDGHDWFEQVLPSGDGLTEMGWEVVPEAFTQMLLELHQAYQLPKMYITENGAAFADQLENGQVHDVARLAYFQGHLNAVHSAIEQGVDIQGYFAWSLMDNFEWALGYSKRFGIVHVDFDTQQRTLKDSALAYKALLEARV